MLSLEEFRLALGAEGRKLSDAELRRAKVECEALARIVFDQVAAKPEQKEKRAA